MSKEDKDRRDPKALTEEYIQQHKIKELFEVRKC